MNMEKELRALLIEDSKIIQIASALPLKAIGFSVDFANSGDEALTMLEQHQYDIIFMDLGLPDVNGISLAQKIRSSENPNAKVPIIALTAYLDEDVAQRCVNRGKMNMAVLKPLTQKIVDEIFTKFAINAKPLAESTETIRPSSASSSSSLLFAHPCSPCVLAIDLSTGPNADAPDKTKQMLDLFVVGLPEQRQKIIAAHQASEWSLLGKLAHYLLGAAIYSGTPRLQTVLRYLETAVMKHTDDNPQNEQIEFYYKLALEEIDAVLDAYSSFPVDPSVSDLPTTDTE